MPTVEEEEIVQPVDTDTGSAPDTGSDGGGSDSPPEIDPLTHGLEGLDPELGGPAPEKPESTDDAPEVPDNITVDKNGLWRDKATGRFSTKQPTEAAAKVVTEAFQKGQTGAEPEVAPVPEPKIEPFVPNIYGKEIELIPGALRAPSGDVLIPAAQVGKLSQLLAHSTKYPEIDQMRKGYGEAMEASRQREAFIGETFATLLSDTLLNPAWMEQAASGPDAYALAQREIKARLKEAQLEQTEKFGRTPTHPTSESQTDPLGSMDPHEAKAGLDSYLDELIASPAYHGTLTAADKTALLAELHNAPIFAPAADGSPGIIEWPVVLAVKMFAEKVKAERRTRDLPKVEVAVRRNAAATGAHPTPVAKPRPAASTASATSTAPTFDPDRPWDDKSLSREERKALFNKANKIPSYG